MGCTATRDHYSIEEKAIVNREDALGFGKLSAKDTDYLIRKYSASSMELELNENQFNLLKKDLKLNAEPNHVKTFLGKIKNGDAYDGEKLLILGILLGKSRSSTKGRLLYEVCDSSYSEKINRHSVERLIKKMFEVVVEFSPLLVDDTIPHPATKKIVEDYVDILKKYKEKSIEKISNDILGQERTEISSDEFSHSMSIEGNDEYTVPSGLRKVAYYYYLEDEEKRKRSNSGKAKKESGNEVEYNAEVKIEGSGIGVSVGEKEKSGSSSSSSSDKEKHED